MRSVVCGASALLLALAWGCVGDDPAVSSEPSGTSSSSGGDASTGTSSSSSSGAPAEDGGSTSSSSSGGSSSSGEPARPCDAERVVSMNEHDEVANRTVKLVQQEGADLVLYVDASGPDTESRVYVDLAHKRSAGLSDVAAQSSSEWDLSFRGIEIFGNGGAGGPGSGTSVAVAKAYAAVTAADADGLEAESFLDSSCEPILGGDNQNELQTQYSDWWSYESGVGIVPVAATTYVLEGGDGKRYKLAIESYQSLETGADGTSSNSKHYRLRYAPLAP